MRKILFILTLIILGTAGSAFAQDHKFPGDTTMNFENSTFSKVYYFEVEPSHKEIQQTVAAKISDGYLSIKILNPMGFRSCGFTLKTNNGARGTSEEVHESPPKGKWKVKIEAKNCSGKANVAVKLR